MNLSFRSSNIQEQGKGQASDEGDDEDWVEVKI